MVGSGGSHRFHGSGLRRLSKLRGFVLVAGACLGPTLTLGFDFAVLPFFPVVFTTFRVGLRVTGLGVVLGEGEDAALMTRPPRTTWFQPCPNLSCSAVCTDRCAFGATEGLGALPTLLRTKGARLASAALASFHFAQPRSWLCGFLRSCSTSASAVGWSTPLKGERHHKQHTGVRSHSTAAYGRGVDSACTAGVLSGRRMSPPRLANRRARLGSVLSPLLVPALPSQ